MKIRMKNLIITDYCSSDKRKYRFIKEMAADQLIRNFVTSNIEELIETSKDNDKLEIGPAYIIEEQRKLVGIVRLAALDIDGTVNLHYAVHPDYRKKHYGTNILKEISNYLFKNMSSIYRIELHIKEINKGSIKCAENAEFKLSREFYPVKGDSLVKVYALQKI